MVDTPNEELVRQGDDALRAGLAARRAGDMAQAAAAYERALQLYLHAGSESRVVLALVNRGAVEQFLGEFEAALATFQDALRRSLELDDQQRIAVCEGNLAAVYLELGDDAAEPLLRSALQRYEALGDPSGMGNQLGNLGMLHQRRGEYADAQRALEAAATAFVAAGNGAGAAASLRVLGDVFRRIGDSETAADAFERALYLARQVEDTQGEAYARRAVGQLHLASGDVDLATGHFRAALSLHEQAGDARGLSAAHLDLGQALVSHGDVADGLAHLGEAVTIARRHHLAGEALGTTVLALGGQLALSGRLDEATALLDEAVQLFDALRDPQGSCAARLHQASMAVSRGAWSEAGDLLTHCTTVADDAGLLPLLASIAAMRGQLAQLRGRYREAISAFGAAIEGFEASGRERLGGTARISRAILQMELGETEGIGDELRALRAAAQAHHNRGSEADALQGLGELARALGSFDEAIAHYDEAIALVSAADNPGALAGVLVNRAEVRLRSERWDSAHFGAAVEAREDLERAIDIAERIGLRPRRAMALVWRAEAHRRLGEVAAARRDLDAARTLAAELRYPMCEGLADQMDARLAAAVGDDARCRALWSAAVDRFDDLGAVLHHREIDEDFAGYDRGAT